MTSDPARQALNMPEVRAASLRQRDGLWTGVVSTADVEYDVRQIARRPPSLRGPRWVVSNDIGRRFHGFTLRGALRRALAAEPSVPHPTKEEV